MFEVVGYKLLSGTSKKTGKPFDFAILWCKVLKPGRFDVDCGDKYIESRCTGEDFRLNNIAIGDHIYLLQGGGIAKF